MSRLILVLGDQLSDDLSALRHGDPKQDVVVMAEVMEEAEYVPHHPQKIALIFAAMRKFAARLREEGWQVCYTTLDDAENAGSIVGELLRRASHNGADEVLCTEPGEWRLIDKLKHAPIKTSVLPDDRFIASHAEFEGWAEGRKSLRMEYFYREMRRKTGLLMEEGKPAGGAWNFDHDNRKGPPKEINASGPMQFTPDAITEEVLDLVEARFGAHFGAVRPFHYATDRAQALRALGHWIKRSAADFGTYQDAMMEGEPFLFHAVLSPYINIGLLSPLEVCEAVEEAYEDGEIPINAAEGFIRQIIGWREYIRGIYFLEGPDYRDRNVLGHDRALPDLLWGGETRMNCLSQTLQQVETHAYGHHIQRLMILGNFGLVAGLHPGKLHDWFMASFVDAFEWVMAANVVGMSQFADGGLMASKPYVSSGAYINRMSNYCKGCTYAVAEKTGERACPFNLLYWHFLDRHRDRFESNARMGNMYRTWDRMDETKRETVLQEAEDWLARLDAGEAV